MVNKGLILAGHDISAGGLITTLLEMCFANVEGGLEISLDKMKETDIVKILFAENPGIVIQISDKHKDEVKKILEDAGVGFIKLGKPTDERHILVNKEGATYQFGIDYMRDVWYSSSYLLDRKQSMNGCAKKRFENYKMQPLEFAFMPGLRKTFTVWHHSRTSHTERYTCRHHPRERNERRTRNGLLTLSCRLRRERRDDDRPDQRNAKHWKM